MRNRIKLFNIYVEDCLNTMLKMADGSVDLILTSPPYDDYDPFFGSATSGKVAEILRRKWIASEISEEYVRDIAIPRLKIHKRKPTLL